MKLRASFAAFLLLSALPVGRAFAQQPPVAADAGPQRPRSLLFADYHDQHPDAIWSPDVPAAARQAVTDYEARKTGNSLRGLRFEGWTARDVDIVLMRIGFTRHDDYIRDSTTHEPVLDGQKRPVRMLVYTHADGSAVRVKPDGDPTSRIRPQPDVMKTVRYPADGDYRDFGVEAFKIEAKGDRPIPKWPKDLFNPYKGTALEKEFVDGWGDAAHGDLKVLTEFAAR